MLLLEVPVRQFHVNATPYDPGRALGTVQPQPDHDDFGRPTAMRLGGISVGLRHNWLAALWWRGLGVIDGRGILEVRRQPQGPNAGRIIATVIDWAGDVPYAETTTRPGWVDTTDVPLLRDRAGRWHRADPTARTTMRRVSRGCRRTLLWSA
jgi:hypothetical protein